MTDSTSCRRMNEYQSQIGALKQEKEEDLRQQRDLRNKIKTLQDRVEDLEHEEEVSERKKQEVNRDHLLLFFLVMIIISIVIMTVIIIIIAINAIIITIVNGGRNFVT